MTRVLKRGFTLVDVLVSIAVVAVLISILLPALGKVHEASQRVVCSSNLRQVGLGVHMYANDFDMWLPPSAFASGAGDSLGIDPLFLRIDAQARGGDGGLWDGLGYLFAEEYLSDPRIFYCPSHTGENGFEAYADRFSGSVDGDIIANYQYRGEGPTGERRLDLILDSAALVSDGFRERSDINHLAGMNVLRAGMSVAWFGVDFDEFYDVALSLGDEDGEGPNWEDSWSILDQPADEQGGFWSFW